MLASLTLLSSRLLLLAGCWGYCIGRESAAILEHWRWRVGIWVLLGRRQLRDSGAIFGEGIAVLALLGLRQDWTDEVSMQ